MTVTKPHTAIVIGGSSGIGLATVKLFLKKGVQVVIGDINVKDGEAIAKSLNEQAGYVEGQGNAPKVTFIPADVTDPESLEKLIRKAVEIYGSIEFAVNTAGITGPIIDSHLISPSDFSKVLQVDLIGTYNFSAAIIRHWRSDEVKPRLIRDDSSERPEWEPVTQRGSLVNIASSLGSEGKPGLGAYCAAKHAVVGLSKVLALENAQHGIRVNTISPGLCMTPIMRSPGFDYEKAKTEYLSDQPMARFAHPAEIAASICFTAMDGASFMHGSDWGGKYLFL